MHTILPGIIKRTHGKDIIYHGKSVISDLNCVAHAYPEWSAGTYKYSSADILMRDGSTYTAKGTAEDTELTFQIIWFKAYEDDSDIREKYLQLRKWIYGKGPERLYEHPGFFWKVKKAEITPDVMKFRQAASWKVTFTVEAHEYLESGTEPSYPEEWATKFLASDSGPGSIYQFPDGSVLGTDDRKAIVTDDGRPISITYRNTKVLAGDDHPGEVTGDNARVITTDLGQIMLTDDEKAFFVQRSASAGSDISYDTGEDTGDDTGGDSGDAGGDSGGDTPATITYYKVVSTDSNQVITNEDDLGFYVSERYEAATDATAAKAMMLNAVSEETDDTTSADGDGTTEATTDDEDTTTEIIAEDPDARITGHVIGTDDDKAIVDDYGRAFDSDDVSQLSPDGFIATDDGKLIDLEERNCWDNTIVITDDDGRPILSSNGKPISTEMHAVYFENEHAPTYPTFIVNGGFECIIKINDNNDVKFFNSHLLVVDTYRNIAYISDGVKLRNEFDGQKITYDYDVTNLNVKEMQNTKVKGDYEDLFFDEGTNRILVSDCAQVVTIPNWRCY